MVRRIATVALYALCAGLVGESAARAVLSIDPLFKRIRGEDDSSRRLDFVKRHSNKRHFTYNFDAYHPVRGWALAPNLRARQVFRGKILNSNSRGVRGPVEYPYARVPGKHRILILGDSYTFGDEVSDHETYSSYLAAMLPNSEVLNLGIHGYGHDQMLLYFTEEGAKYRPDVVILGYVWFDQYRNVLMFNDFAKPRYQVTSNGLRVTNVPIPRPGAVLAGEIFRLKLIDLLVMARARVRERSGRYQQEARVVTSAIFDELLKAVRATGATPVLVYLPVLKELADTQPVMSRHELALDAYCRSRHVACLFLRARFREAIAKGVAFNTRRHWAPPEHQLAAQGIRDFLAQRNLLPALPSTTGGQ
jgi:hypothetical protein